MTELNYPLSILAKAVAYRNLSSASLHVGLSQPQLSRLVSKIEKELGVELLDRKVKRKSAWTPQAMKLAELFHDNQLRLEHAIRSIQSDQRVRQVHFGTLEGLADTAMAYSKKLFDDAALERVFIDVFDRNELESKFLAGDLDLIINTRLPSHAKPKYVHVCGYQSLDEIVKNHNFKLFSTFEFNAQRKSKKELKEKALISNSLFVRKQWMEKYGGHGFIPSSLSDKAKKGLNEVLLIGGDWLDPFIWKTLR